MRGVGGLAVRPSFWVWSLSPVSSLLLLAGTASAAQLTEISWEVTGGTVFTTFGPCCTPITGGSLVYHPPGEFVSTPVANLVGGSFVLTLMGSTVYSSTTITHSVSVRLPGPQPTGNNFASISPGSFAGSAGGLQPAGSWDGLSIASGQISSCAFGAGGSACQAGWRYVLESLSVYPPAGANFTLGNEVRTQIAEASATSWAGRGLLGAGLLGLGLAGLVSGRLRRPGPSR